MRYASRFKKEKEITNLILVRKRQQAEVKGETGDIRRVVRTKKQ